MSEQMKKSAGSDLAQISEEDLAQINGGTEHGWKSFKKDLGVVEKVANVVQTVATVVKVIPK
jgi:bacteriocin-like protein